MIFTIVLALCTTILALLVLLRRSQTIPAHLPWAGRKHNGYLQSMRSYLRSIAGTHKMLEEGYDKYSKNELPFVLPILFTGAEIMLPPSSLNWIHDQPDNVLSGFEAHREFMRADWTLLHPTIIHEHIFQAVISKQLTRHLDELEDELRAEIPIALETHIAPNGNEWHEVDGYKSWKKTILQVVSRIYVGEALCHDQDYIQNAVNFNRYSMLIAGLIGLVPALLRPVIAPLICLPDRYFHNACARKTKPLLKQTLEAMRTTRREERSSKFPNTLITWAIEDAYESESAGAPDKTSLDFLAARLSVMNFVSIDSTTITLGNVLFDILYHPWDAPLGSRPSKKPLLERLRDEARIACQTSTSTRRATDSVPLLDACLRESFRMGNFVSRTTVKMVTKAPGVEVPGVGFVKQGVKVGVPLWGIHHDEKIYDDPWRWRMSRWLKADGRSSSVPLFGGNASESGQQYLPFGYRRSACPGRFFAMRVVKLILLHLLLNYDLEKVGPERPDNIWLGVSRGPPLLGKLRVRRRELR